MSVLKNELKNRKGKFYTTDIFIFDQMENSVELFKMLEFVPLRVEYRMDISNFEYIGCSKYFDVIKFGDEIPEYDIVVGYSDVGIQIDEVVRKNAKDS